MNNEEKINMISIGMHLIKSKRDSVSFQGPELALIVPYKLHIPFAIM